jgi:hypothetical protein
MATRTTRSQGEGAKMGDQEGWRWARLRREEQIAVCDGRVAADSRKAGVAQLAVARQAGQGAV